MVMLDVKKSDIVQGCEVCVCVWSGKCNQCKIRTEFDPIHFFYTATKAFGQVEYNMGDLLYDS